MKKLITALQDLVTVLSIQCIEWNVTRQSKRHVFQFDADEFHVLFGEIFCWSFIFMVACFRRL